MTSPPHKLLVVDDDDDTREVLNEFLASEGYNVLTAANGRDAWSILQREPDACAILLDLMMPVMDGWQFLHLKRQDQRLLPIPVVVISAYRERAPVDGIAAVVGKPIPFERLLTIVQQHCHCRLRP